MRLRVTLRSATRTALICDPMMRSTSSKATACSARRTTSSIGPPDSYSDSSSSGPRMPPRLLISSAANTTLLVEVGPHMPGDPEKVRKLPIRSLLCAPRRDEPGLIVDRSRSSAAFDRFRNSSDGGIVRPPGAGKFTVERTPTPVWHQTKTHPAGGPRHPPFSVGEISYWKILNIQQLKCI